MTVTAGVMTGDTVTGLIEGVLLEPACTPGNGRLMQGGGTITGEERYTVTRRRQRDLRC